MDPPLELIPLPGTYTIHRLHPVQALPELGEGFHSVTNTGEEVSVVCLENICIHSEKSSTGWKCIRVAGPLDLDLSGILHDLIRPLKMERISIFAISTYNTDYLLIPGKSYHRAIELLSATYQIKSQP